MSITSKTRRVWVKIRVPQCANRRRERGRVDCFSRVHWRRTRPPLEMELVHAWPCCGEQLGNPLSIEVSAGTEVQVNVEMPVSAQVSESFILTTRLDPRFCQGIGSAVGDRLLVGQSLISNSGRYRLTYQSDGNLVLYDLATGTALWWTGTFTNRPGQAVMQGDGNLVLYRPRARANVGVRHG